LCSISLWLCNYMLNSLPLRLLLSHFPIIHVYLWLFDLNWISTHVAYFMKYIRTDNGFSNSGMHTITSTLTIVYWYAALIKIWNIKFNKLKKKNISHTHLPVHRIIYLGPLLVIVSDFQFLVLIQKRIINGTLKSLNFI